ncbi:MAG: muconolactone Delta-isomerase family protein [Chloroflexota bacterium]
MLVQVEMTVDVPHGIDHDRFEILKREEREIAQMLQTQGIWRHLWRHVGLYANTSIFSVESLDQLHEILITLPLYPYLRLTITPLCRHPSSIHDDDR